LQKNWYKHRKPVYVRKTTNTVDHSVLKRYSDVPKDFTAQEVLGLRRRNLKCESQPENRRERKTLQRLQSEQQQTESSQKPSKRILMNYGVGTEDNVFVSFQ